MIKLSVGICLAVAVIVLKGCQTLLSPDVIQGSIQLGFDVAEAVIGIDLDQDGDVAGVRKDEKP